MNHKVTAHFGKISVVNMHDLGKKFTLILPNVKINETSVRMLFYNT